MPSLTPDALVRLHGPQLALPAAVRHLNDMVSDSNYRAADIADDIGQDPRLCVRLLRLINSPFYAPAKPIDSVAGALALVGARELRDLALAVTIMRRFQTLPRDLLDARGFWRHSLATALLAHQLAGQIGAGQRSRYLLAGLLHDIGRAVACLLLPDASGRMLRRLAESPEADRDALAIEVLGFDHAELGAALLRYWRLPESVVAAVRHHLQPEHAGGFGQEAATVYLAELLADSVAPRPGRVAVRTAASARELLGVGTACLERVRAAVDGQMPDVERLYSALAA